MGRQASRKPQNRDPNPTTVPGPVRSPWSRQPWQPWPINWLCLSHAHRLHKYQAITHMVFWLGEPDFSAEIQGFGRECIRDRNHGIEHLRKVRDKTILTGGCNFSSTTDAPGHLAWRRCSFAVWQQTLHERKQDRTDGTFTRRVRSFYWSSKHVTHEQMRPAYAQQTICHKTNRARSAEPISAKNG